MAGEYSTRARAALATFGLSVHDDAPGAPEMQAHAHAIDQRVAFGQSALVIGPSGAGKSTLLRALAKRTGATDAAALAHAACARTSRVIDLFTGPIPETLRLLASAGLADARVFVRRASDLSDGQRARLGVALAMSRTANTIILDEFCSGLDAATARSLCCTLTRWLDRSRHARIICATARDEVRHWLAPALLVHVQWGGGILYTQPPAAPAQSNIDPPVIEPGDLADYHALAPLHYRAGRPATIRRILRAREGDTTVGVLVTSMPTLNGSWRPRAFAHRYSRGTPRERAALLNREVRCISRIIIDPRYRARGIASALVRFYLRNPETTSTEAVAAMGAACPLFTRAGMTEWPLLPSPRDRRLTRTLAELGHTAADLAAIQPRTRTSRDPRLARALRTWANAARSTRPLIHDPEAIARAASHSLAGRGRAYTWSTPSSLQI